MTIHVRSSAEPATPDLDRRPHKPTTVDSSTPSACDAAPGAFFAGREVRGQRMLVRIAAALVAMAVTASGLKGIDLLAQVESAATSTAVALTRGKSTGTGAGQAPGTVLSATPED